jgi:hypothetical protein
MLLEHILEKDAHRQLDQKQQTKVQNAILDEIRTNPIIDEQIRMNPVILKELRAAVQKALKGEHGHSKPSHR